MRVWGCPHRGPASGHKAVFLPSCHRREKGRGWREKTRSLTKTGGKKCAAPVPAEPGAGGWLSPGAAGAGAPQSRGAAPAPGSLPPVWGQAQTWLLGGGVFVKWQRGRMRRGQSSRGIAHRGCLSLGRGAGNGAERLPLPFRLNLRHSH